MSSRDAVQVKNVAKTIINPATEEKQDNIITSLSNIETNQTDSTQKTQIVNTDGDHFIPDPMLTIAAGEAVAISRVSYINKFGRNPDIDTGTDPEDIVDAGGLHVVPTLARIHNIASTVANDVGTVLSSGTATGGSTTSLEDTGATFSTDTVLPGDIVINDTNFDHATVVSVTETVLTLGLSVHANDPAHSEAGEFGFNVGDTYRVVTAPNTGASITHVFGLDADMLEQEEFVINNGTTDVATVGSYYRIYRMHVDGAAGRTTTNIGDITATAVTDATVTAQISAGNGTTGMAFFTIPKGKTGYMTHVFADLVRGKSAVASITLRETISADIDGAGSRIRLFFGLEAGAGHFHHMYKPYEKFLENTDVWVRCDEVSANDMDISAGFGIILVDNV